MNQIAFWTAAVIAIATAATAFSDDASWSSEVRIDDFTDEVVAVANVDIQHGRNQWTLFVNCRDDESLNIGITGSYVNPVGGTRKGSQTIYDIPVRLDDGEVRELQFTEQGDTLFLVCPPVICDLLLEMGDLEGRNDVETRNSHIFLRGLSTHNRLRVKFPQYKGNVTLAFPLEGALHTLVHIARECGITSPGDTAAFVDAAGTPYETLADMLADESSSSE